MSDLRMEKGEKTRDTLLHAAISIIAESGLNEISASKLAKAAGVSKSTIFHHFKSNDELLIGALQLVFNNLLQSMELGRFNSVEHFLDALGQSMLQVKDTNLTFIKAFLSFFHGGVFHPLFREALASYTEQMNEHFRTQLSQLASDSIRQETIESVSLLLLPMIDGIGFHFLLHGDREKYEQMWKLQTQAILHLLNDSTSSSK